MGSISACFVQILRFLKGGVLHGHQMGIWKLFSRVVEINAERPQFNGNPNLVTEYDVPVDAWYTEKNSYPTVPYSVLMEIALQPCGFFVGLCWFNVALSGRGFLFPQFGWRRSVSSRI